MKNILKFAILFVSVASYSQIYIGETENTTTTSSGVLMDFEKTNNRGILLPAVISTSSIVEQGTMVLDASNPTQAQFKVKLNDNEWFVYSRQNGNATAITTNRPLINDYAEAKVVIGAESSDVDGALVFESTDKALILPIVSSIDNIANPSPGMLVFLDKNTCTSFVPVCIDQFLAFYNGTEWSFFEYVRPGITIDPPYLDPCDPDDIFFCN